MKHAPTRKLSDAVFRGKEAEHTFKVYPLTAPITDQPAVFIISRRIVDTRGRGHQVAICIGETDSTVRELRKHKRSKCVKDHSMNVVCLLKEKDADSRRAVIDDLMANRSFSCVRNIYKPKIESTPKRVVKKSRAASKATNEKLRTISNTGKPAATRKRKAAAGTGKRVSGGMDRDSRQHRLPKSKGTVTRKAKRGTPKLRRAGKKAAA
jgi:hypothetical protein